MIWYVVILHILLAILLFFIVNWLGAHSSPMGYMQLSLGMQDDTSPAFNYLFKVLAPVVFMVLIAALFQLLGLQSLNKSIYRVVIFYWVFRLLYVVARGHASLLNWSVQFFYWISSVGLAIWSYTLIDRLGTILPSPQSLIEQLWLLIILFIYSIINKLEISRGATERRKASYIDRQYKNLSSRFSEQVNSYFKRDFLRALTFSIMVYENYNRSGLIRYLERILFKRSKRKHTYGVMQVMSDSVLSDEESVELGMRKIRDDCRVQFNKLKESSLTDYWLVNKVSQEYNGGDIHYSSEVWDVYSYLKEKYYPSIPEEIKKKDI